MNLLKKLGDWFTNNQALEDRIKAIEEKNKVTPVATLKYEPIRQNKIIYNASSGAITVVSPEGNTFSNSCCTNPDDLEKLKIATEKQIVRILTPAKPNVEESEEEVEQIITNYQSILEESADFEKIGNEIFFKGIKSVAIPTIICGEFIRLLQEMDKFDVWDNESLNPLREEYNSLKMWTLKLLLNPTKESREQALEYVKNFNIKLTNTGNMIMYRRIVSKGNSNKDLVEFISKSYLKVKGWKKAPSNYEIFKTEEGNYICHCKNADDVNYDIHCGNLAELYSNLFSMKENRYTDDYTKSYDIRLGAVYKINDKDIDVNRNGSCGGALHVADGVKFNYSSFGNTPVCVLVNPMHVYKMDSGCSGKIGVREMFICAVTSQDEEGNYEDIDNQSLVNFDEIYHNESIAELEEALITKSFNNLCVGDKISNLNLLDVNSIKTMLSNRVVSI